MTAEPENPVPSSRLGPYDFQRTAPPTLEDRVILYAALAFFLVTIALVGLPLLLAVVDKGLPIGDGWYAIFTSISALLGFSLVRTLRNARKEVIPRQDRDILDAALQRSPDPVREYVVLSGLIGATGVFRKLEFTGMPLATILMTLFMSLLSVLCYALNAISDINIPEQVPQAFLELAKLTLGAFIGSFVSKGTAQEEQRATLSHGATSLMAAVAEGK